MNKKLYDGQIIGHRHQFKLLKMLLSALLLIGCVVQNVSSETPTKGIINEPQVASKLETSEPMSTSPSITSVHQVWTSTSSGDLQELSPETIGKLRNDVPFLAAYAVRPRLVGTTIGQSSGGDQSAPVKNGRLDTSASQTFGTQSLEPVGTVSSRSLVPKLGDFSEFKVETSSVSKSEHRHKRKTSLKRRQNDELSMKRRILAGASQLIKRRRRQKQNSSKRQKSLNKSQKISKGLARNRINNKSSRKGKRKNRLARLRQRLDRRNLLHHMNIIRHGRYFQEQSVSPSEQGDTNDIKMRSMGRDTTTTIMMDPSGVKGGNDAAGVKGGKAPTIGKRPFHEAGRPKVMNTIDDIDGPVDSVDDESSMDKSMTSPDRDSNSVATGNGIADEDDQAIDDEDDDLPPPKRVGDDDVEKDGDTVLIEPKSDGVDDDPAIESAEDGEPEEGTETARDNGDDGAVESDERGRRTNREKPNLSTPNDGSPSDDSDESDDDRDGGVSNVGGGGIGATIGGGSGGSGSDSTSGRDGSSSGDSDKEDESGDNRPKSSVEFANDDESVEKKSRDDDKDLDEAEKGRPQISEGDGSRKSDSDSSGSSSGSDGSFGDRRRPASSGGRDSSIDSGSNDAAERKTKTDTDSIRDDEDDDLDYRDEMAKRDGDAKKTDHKDSTGKKVHQKDEDHCNDGHHHGDDHHHHHGIEWLRGAIPGEPDDDYPILSRSNLTNFNCGDQKYPGYYADVEARCQIFHICQADGRQDSFLCPNGTIFSQKTLVCVWWNGFDCEDAPKYYPLNALLYKQSSTSDSSSYESPQQAAIEGNLRPPANGVRRMGSTINGVEREDDDEQSSIDNLIRGMRRRQNGSPESDVMPSSSRRGSMMEIDDMLSADEEASIQRKSTNVDDDPETVRGTTSSRFRAHDSTPRRKRRASMRQAPPKLRPKYRSRRNRLRTKPKRRA